MYRVAVIQNESEMLRSGYTNIIPKLNKIKRFSQYSFEMFSIVNINKLFQEGDQCLNQYDSLFITTNSTSDKTVLSKLRQNKDYIKKFLDNGKGIFISSQKKISSELPQKDNSQGKTNFLPDEYEFLTVERPSEETDSGKGNISIYKNESNILLRYPNTVTEEQTISHCINNEFRRHFYRSHILPVYKGAYLPILVDESYKDIKCRNLLMVNLLPKNNERLILSTIALDWEYHENLLTNIITFITEGLPKVAFIDKSKNRHNDFDFLITSVKLSKISYEIYNNIEEIRKELFNVHNIYIFSPDWHESKIFEFINIFKNKENNPEQRPYIRIYFFRQVDNTLTLAQYSNFNTIDLIIDGSVLWINSMFSGKMWANSFWITFDILIMMMDIGFNISTYLMPIFKDIKKHYKEYSYDNVIGATCGLLDLIFQLRINYNDILESEGFDIDNLYGIINWIEEKYQSLSIYDKLTTYLTLDKCSTLNETNKKENDLNIKINNLISLIKSDFNKFNTCFDGHDHLPETDICRFISFLLRNNKSDVKISQYLNYLKTIQSPSGKWTNIGRTAHVLIFLLNNIQSLKKYTGLDFSLDDMIYYGILYLRSEYNRNGSNWDNDIHASAKAIHAIGLYNKLYKYSTQDFFKTLEIESNKIFSATMIKNISESLHKLRQQSNDMTLNIESLSTENAKRETKIKELEQDINRYSNFEEDLVNDIKRHRVISAFSVTLFLLIVLYMALKHPLDVLKEINLIDTVSLVIGLMGGFIIPIIALKTYLRSETLKNYKKLFKEKKT